MKFLIDNQLPPALGKWMASHGHEAIHVLDLSLAQAKATHIWDHAAANGFIVVTKDEDFAQRATVPGAEVRVVWVRLGNCRTAALLAAFDYLLAQMVAALDSGARLVEIR